MILHLRLGCPVILFRLPKSCAKANRAPWTWFKYAPQIYERVCMPAAEELDSTPKLPSSQAGLIVVFPADCVTSPQLFELYSSISRSRFVLNSPAKIFRPWKQSLFLPAF